MGKLNARQELFCKEYLIDLNATQAAIRAGYKAKTARAIACENLTKPDIAARIEQLKEEREKSLQIDAKWVLERLVRLHERCMEAEPVTDKEGNNLGFAQFHPSGAAKSLELIGRHVSVKAFEAEATNIINNQIMPVPQADSVDDWEQAAQAHHEKVLGDGNSV